MLEVIKNLLALQERDRRLLRLGEELSHMGPERQTLSTQANAAQARLEAAKLQARQIEADRKRLELEVEAQKQLIAKYSLQQFQTRKNEEYRALTHEIDTCKDAISQLEDRILGLMVQADEVQQAVATHSAEARETKALVDAKLAELATREAALQKEQATLNGGRAELAQAVDDTSRHRYERLLRSKGNKVVVGIQGGVCGGCHMTLQRQVVVTCQAEQEPVACPNCGRILYFTPDMDTTAAE
jgi:uncharacterized protein